MGRVYLAFDLREPGPTRTPRAVKMLIDAESASEEAVKLFKSEASIALKMRHGNLASSIEVLSDDRKKNHAIVMDYIEGISLRRLNEDCIRRGRPLDLDLVLFLGLRVAEGLKYLHHFRETGPLGLTEIVHGDLSPRNIMLQFDGDVKLIDFGLSRPQVYHRNELMATTYATPWYASPTRVRLQQMSTTDDIFGFGVIFWELVTGTRYFGENDAAAVLKELRTFRVRDPREGGRQIPTDIAEMIMNCLDSESLNGLTSADDLYISMQNLSRKFAPHVNKEYLKKFIDQFYGPLVKSHAKYISSQQARAAEFLRENPPAPTQIAAACATATGLDEAGKVESPPGVRASSQVPTDVPSRDSVRPNAGAKFSSKDHSWLIFSVGVCMAILAVTVIQLRNKMQSKRRDSVSALAVNPAGFPASNEVKTDRSSLRAANQGEGEPDSSATGESANTLQPQVDEFQQVAAAINEDSVWVLSRPQSAEILLNGAVVGRTPMQLPRKEKPYFLNLRGEGFAKFSTVIDPAILAISVNLEAGTSKLKTTKSLVRDPASRAP